jgi:Magnetochrome domain
LAQAKGESHHDIAVWIMAFGIAFALALFSTAILNINPWEDHTYQMAPPIVAGMPAPHRDGREEMVCSSCHIVTTPKLVSGAPAGAVLPIVAGTPSPHTDARAQMKCDACHTIITKGGAIVPKEPPVAQSGAALQTKPVALQAGFPNTARPPGLPNTALPQVMSMPGAGEEELNIPPYRFQGKVLKVAGTGGGSVWGDVYILLDDRINDPIWINLSPRWYLQAGGCLVRAGVFVKGMAFRDPNADNPTPSYAMSLMVNGEFCTLRDQHMRGLWTKNGGAADVE